MILDPILQIAIAISVAIFVFSVVMWKVKGVEEVPVERKRKEKKEESKERVRCPKCRGTFPLRDVVISHDFLTDPPTDEYICPLCGETIGKTVKEEEEAPEEKPAIPPLTLPEPSKPPVTPPIPPPAAPKAPLKPKLAIPEPKRPVPKGMKRYDLITTKENGKPLVIALGKFGVIPKASVDESGRIHVTFESDKALNCEKLKNAGFIKDYYIEEG